MYMSVETKRFSFSQKLIQTYEVIFVASFIKHLSRSLVRVRLVVTAHVLVCERDSVRV